MSDKLYDLRDILCEELDKIAERGELSAGELDTAQKLTSTIKNIDKIIMVEEDGGYSGADGEWMANGTYGRGSSYRNQRRDSMGRYSRNYGGGNYSNRGRYSRNGYSMAGEMDNITMQIEELMNSGNLTAAQKTAYKKALDMMKDA